MDFLLPLLAMFTLLAGIVFAIWSQAQTEKRKKDDSIRESSLARDGDSQSKAP